MNKVKLGNLCKICSSKRIHEADYVSSGIPFVRGLEITNGDLLKPNVDYNCYITRDLYSQIKNKYGVPKKGDILITAVGTVGNVCYIDVDKEFYFKDGNIIWFKDFDKKINAKYLYYYMQSPYFKKQLDCALIGAVQKALTMVMLSEINVPIPDYDIQCYIASTLEKIDDKIKNNNGIISELESMAKTLYDYWFLQFEFPNEEGKPYKSSGGKMVWNEELKRDIPEGWSYETLYGKYSIERGISYSSKDIENNTGMAMINLACIDINRNYRTGELKYFDGVVKEKNILNHNDLLVACTDLTRNADIVGCPILTPDDGVSYTYSMDIAKIIPNEKWFNKYFLYMTLRTDFYHNYIKKWASGTNVLHLNLKGIDWYKTWIPPKELQNKFATIVKDVHSKKSSIIKENQQLTSLRDFLLPMLMNGQVTFKKEGESIA